MALAKDMEFRLSHDQIIAVFTQGEIQPYSVTRVEDGLLGLLSRYERRRLTFNGTLSQIPIVPVGLDYDLRGRGLVLSQFADTLADMVLFFPRWTVPALGSRITVRIGRPHYSGGRSSENVTGEVMKEAAALSHVPYRFS